MEWNNTRTGATYEETAHTDSRRYNKQVGARVSITKMTGYSKPQYSVTGEAFTFRMAEMQGANFPLINKKIFDKTGKNAKLLVIITLQGEVNIFLRNINRP